MARKRYILFRVLQPFLSSISFNKIWQRSLLALLTALFCAVAAPIWAKAPASTAVQVQAPDRSLLQQGKTFYDAGQYSQAVEVLKRAVTDYASSGDKVRQALTLSNLSLAYQQLSLWDEAKAAIADSLKILQDPAVNTPNRLQALAQALDIQGRLQFSLGQAQSALDSWEQASKTYTQTGDRTSAIASQINQVQALQALGLYRRAVTQLTQINENLTSMPDSLTKAVGLRSFGDVLQLVGDLDKSRQVLQQSLEISRRLQSLPNISAALFSLGNTARAQQDTQAALNFYQQAAQVSTSTTKIQAQLNQLSLLIDTKQWQNAQALVTQVQPQLAQLPTSRAGIYARINFAQSLKRLGQGGVPNAPTTGEIAQILATATQQAKETQDRRSEAYALGSLGNLYEQNQQLAEAKDLTNQALLISQAIDAPDLSYRWQWQLGRVLKAQGNETEAIASYTEAVNTLQSLRGDLVAINPNVEFSFRESVEPVYRQLVSLLLESEETTKDNQKNLDRARNVFESLQAAELVNFFRAECLTATPVQIDRLDTQAAVIYPVILADRLEVILSIPKQPLRHYATRLKDNEVETVLATLRQQLVRRTSRSFLPASQQVYDWLIRPAEADLAKNNIKTLVFVLDGSLRNIPMAALHDGKQYLVEKYSLALTPGLQLLPPESLQQRSLKVLTAGLTQARQNFPALTNVRLELQEIQSEVPSVKLLDREFTSKALQKELDSVSFPVVHIASHGQFSSTADDTFILTWDNRINVNQLDNLLRVNDPQGNRAIELLVLSACRTVAGDRRAALGLAGVAIRAGARSTLASLWYVSDAATVPLMSQFYKELASNKVSRAEALRRAQQVLLQDPQYRHPVYWSPYVLVGNWL